MSGFRPHLILLLLAAAIGIQAAATHISTDDALSVAFDDEAPPLDRVWAAHVASNRATERSATLGNGLAQAFLSSQHEVLREAALTIDLCRHAVERSSDADDRSPPLQDDYVYGRSQFQFRWSPHRLRSTILYRRKVGGRQVGGIRRVTSTEADWFLRTLRGDDLPPDSQIEAYFHERFREVASIQGRR